MNSRLILALISMLVCFSCIVIFFVCADEQLQGFEARKKAGDDRVSNLKDAERMSIGDFGVLEYAIVVAMLSASSFIVFFISGLISMFLRKRVAAR